MTIYADPKEELPEETIAALAAGFSGQRGSTHRQRENMRHNAVLRSRHEALIAERIAQQFHSDDVKNEMRKFISVTCNPAHDIVEAVCAVWNHGVHRRIAKASASQLEAFSRLVAETDVDANASEWNRVAYYVGPVVVLPKVRNGKLRHEPLYPHTTELAFDPRDPLGPPIAAAYMVSPRGDNKAMANFAVVDSQSIRYYKFRGHLPEEVVELREEHGVGEFPGATLRFEQPSQEDWWIADRHPRLQQGSFDVGRIFAAMNFVRRAQNKHLLTLIGPKVSLATGQSVGDPEMPIVQNVPKTAAGGADYTIDTLSFNTDPKNFLTEIRFIIEQMAESTGVPVTVQASPGTDLKFDTELDHNALTEFRNNQIHWARNFEKDLWEKSLKVVRASESYPGDQKAMLPKTMDGFSAEFSPMPRKFADPRVEMEWWEFLISKGAASVLDILRRQNPMLSPQEIKDIHKRNTKENEQWWAEVAARNGAVNDTGDAVSAAQKNGSLGGRPTNLEKRQKSQDNQDNQVTNQDNNSNGNG